VTKSMRNAVGYARTSSKLNPKASIPNQCKLINEYCEKNDIFLKEVYIDEAKTATKVKGRTGYMKLKSDLENGDIDIVIVSFFDRLAREAFEFVLTVVELNKKGVEIISISEDLSSKRMSPIHLAMIAFEIEHENKQRTERIHGAIEENRKKGIYNLPYIPLGYIKDKNSRLVLDVRKVLEVKYVFHVYLNCKSIYETVEQINGMEEQQIISILEDKTYNGYIYTKKITKDKELQYNQRSFVKHPVIIDEITFEQVRILREQERKPKKAPFKCYILKNIFMCPLCSTSMEAKKGFYYCRNCKDKKLKFQQEKIESKFLVWINTFSIGMVKGINQQDSLSPQIVELEKRKRRIEVGFSKSKSLMRKCIPVNHSL
jgi:site-specific DNA recombinase